MAVPLTHRLLNHLGVHVAGASPFGQLGALGTPTTRLASEQFFFGALGIAKRAVQHRGMDESRDVGAEHVIGGGDFVAELARGMGLANVIGLEERFGGRLPVTGQALADMGLDVTIFETPVGPVVR